MFHFQLFVFDENFRLSLLVVCNEGLGFLLEHLELVALDNRLHTGPQLEVQLCRLGNPGGLWLAFLVSAFDHTGEFLAIALIGVESFGEFFSNSLDGRLVVLVERHDGAMKEVEGSLEWRLSLILLGSIFLVSSSVDSRGLNGHSLPAAWCRAVVVVHSNG